LCSSACLERSHADADACDADHSQAVVVCADRQGLRRLDNPWVRAQPDFSSAGPSKRRGLQPGQHLPGPSRRQFADMLLLLLLLLLNLLLKKSILMLIWL